MCIRIDNVRYLLGPKFVGLTRCSSSLAMFPSSTRNIAVLPSSRENITFFIKHVNYMYADHVYLLIERRDWSDSFTYDTLICI